MRAAFDGENNLGAVRLRSVEVIPQVDGGYGVAIDFNADDNLTVDFIRGGIGIRMRDAYKALYTSSADVRAAWISAWFPLTDKFGNTTAERVYKTILDIKIAKRINWSDPVAVDWPNVWDVAILHPALRD